MKKKILGGFTIAFIAAVAAFNINFNMNENNELSAISLANVEALADGEGGDGGQKCWKTITSKEGSQVLYCGTCSWVSGTFSWVSGSSTC